MNYPTFTKLKNIEYQIQPWIFHTAGIKTFTIAACCCRFGNLKMNQIYTSSTKEQNNYSLKLPSGTSSIYGNVKLDHLDICSKNTQLTEEYVKKQMENRTNRGTSNLKLKTASWATVELTNANKIDSVTEGANGTNKILANSKFCLGMIPENLNSTEKTERENVKLLNKNMHIIQTKSTIEKPNIAIKAGEKSTCKMSGENEQNSDCIYNKNEKAVKTKISFKLKDNKKNLIEKYTGIKRKLNFEEESISSDDMHKSVQKAKMESSYNLQPYNNVKLKRRSKKMVHDTSRNSNEQIPVNISAHLQESAAKRVKIRPNTCKCGKMHCDCFDKRTCHENKNPRKTEYKFSTKKNERFLHHEVKYSSKNSSNAEAISIPVDQGNRNYHVMYPKEQFSPNSAEKNEIHSKMKNNEEMSCKQNTEKKRILSLFSREKDLIRKHVSKGSNSAKLVSDSGNAYRAVQDNKRKRNDSKIPFEKFEYEINTLEDMEFFLAFLRNQKRKNSNQPTKPRKMAKTTRHKHVSKIHEKCTKKRQLQYSNTYEKNKGSKTRKAVDDISTKRHRIKNDYSKIYTIKSASNNRGSIKSSYEAELKSTNLTEQKKMRDEICTLEDMESFLSFLRERKRIASNAENNYKIASTTRISKENNNEEHSANVLQECKSMVHSKQENEEGRTKTTKSLVNVSKNFKTSTLYQNQTENITSTEIQGLIQSKRSISNDEIMKPSGRSLNSDNSKNKELSLENKEEFFQQLTAKKVKEGEEVEVRLNGETEDYLKLSREQIKAKLMSCSTVRSEKISKISEDLKKTKCGVNDNNFSSEYEKALKKIMAETRAIITA